MTSVYIVRHGATKLNNQTDTSQDRIRGWTDVPLAEEGRKEAQAAGLKLKSKGVQAIVASTLSRASETADIIGKIVGVQPSTSEGLRPWNLGEFTGKTTKEALPELAEYARNKPDEAVPKGESFNQFKERAFGGLADAIEANQGKVLVIVTHHRNERLYEAWEAAGRPEDLSIDLDVFLQKGDPPGGIKTLAVGDVEKWEPTSKPVASPTSTPAGPTASPNISPPKRITSSATRLSPDMPQRTRNVSPAGKNGPSMQNPSDNAPQIESQKLTHAAVKYGLAKSGGDKCSACEYFKGKDNCTLVEAPIYPAGWCNKFEAKAADAPGETPAAEAAEQPKPAMNAAALSHGRAIAGAKALHAVGHITAKERDRHIGASQKVISKRKAFGSWAP